MQAESSQEKKSISEIFQFVWDHPTQTRTGTQLAQSGYSPLLTPYLIFGLGQESEALALPTES